MSDALGSLRGIVRPMLDDDIPHVRDLIGQGDLLVAHHPYVYWVMRRNAPELCHVYAHGDEILGFVAGIAPFVKNDTCLLWQIGVRQDVRRLGIANELAEVFLAKASALGFSEVRLTIDVLNEASRNFFQRLARHSRAVATVTNYGEVEGLTEPEECLALHLVTRAQGQ